MVFFGRRRARRQPILLGSACPCQGEPGHDEHNVVSSSRLHEIPRALAVDSKTVTRYLDLLVDLLLVRRLPPLPPCAGVSWEGFVVENILRLADSGAQAGFYRKTAGAHVCRRGGG